MDASFTGSVFLGMSVDGFIARPDGDLAWLTGGGDAGGAPDDGEGGDFGFADFVSGIDALVMGRATYDVIAAFDEAVTALTAAGYRRVYVDGGRTVHDFLAAGLVGELTLSRVPVLIGEGHTPFGPLPATGLLEHVRTRTFPGGMVQTTYRVRRDG